MLCKNCGTENKNNAKFCYNCGKKLVNENKKKNKKEKSEKTSNYITNEVNKKLQLNLKCLDRQIVFEGKYFHEIYLRRLYLNLYIEFEYLAKNIKNTDNILTQMSNYLDDFCVKLIKRMEDVEKNYSLKEQDTIYQELNKVYTDSMINIMAGIEACNNIDQGVDAQVAYRNARKACRGRWVGGGFGLNGAIKGAAQAGMLNLGTGIMHSAVNAVGNVISTIKANGQKRKLVYEIRDEVLNDIKTITDRIIDVYIGIIKKVYPNSFYNTEEAKEKELYNKFTQSTDVQKRDIAIQLLKLNPYKIDVYYMFFDVIKDDALIEQFKNNLTALCKLADKCEVPFDKWLKNIIDNDIDSIEIKRNNLKRLLNIAEIIYNKDEKKLKRFKESIGSNCIKRIRECSIDEVENNVLEYNSFITEFTDSCYLSAFQSLMSYDIRQANNNIEKDIEKEADEMVQRLDFEIILASEENKMAIKKLIADYMDYKTTKILANIDISDSKIVIKEWRYLKEISEKLAYSERESILEQRIYQYIEQSSCLTENEEQIRHLKDYIKELEDNISLKFSDKQKYIKKAEESARTVLGIEYETIEEAKRERKKVVGNKKFDSEEEADAERERLRKEEELSKQEMGLIEEYEKKTNFAPDILKTILESNFKSKEAETKCQEYKRKVLKLYSNLKARNLSAEFAKLRTKQFICLVFGVIALLIGIRPFFVLGWVGKIIIFSIVAFPWSQISEAQEAIKSCDNDKRILSFIEEMFIIQNNDITLRNIKS